MFVSDLKHFGVNTIITFEAHGSHKDIQTYSLASLFKEHKYDVVVSPDEGGRARAEAYAKELGALRKNRVSFDSVVRVMRRTGKDLNEAYRETSLGGLAKEFNI